MVTGPQLMGDSWEWTNGAWRQAHPAQSPSPREIAAMIYDPYRQVVVLYGGRPTLPTTPNFDRVTDTWTWDGRDWTLMHPAHVPNLFAPAITYDTTQHQAVLYGWLEGEIWTWDGTDRPVSATTLRKIAVALGRKSVVRGAEDLLSAVD